MASPYDECDGCGEQHRYCTCEVQFADPGSSSALRRAGPYPRNLPCPTCGEDDKLTPEDAGCGYQCNDCADAQERGGY